jgi:outer membrane protein assembly factor BamB
MTGLLVVSCAKRFHYTEEFARQASVWPFYRGDLQARGVFPDGSFSGKLDLLWSDKFGYRAAAPLTIQHGHLVVPTTGKKIHFYDLEDGSMFGRLRLKGTGQTAVLVKDNLLFTALGPIKNRVEAIDLTTKKTIWRAAIKDAAPAPIIVNDRLIIGSGEGTLYALELATGHRVWDFSGDGRFTAPIAYSDGRIFQPSDDGTLYALSDTTGEKLYEVKLDGPLVGGAAISGIVCIASMAGNVYGLNAEDGAILWQNKLAGPIWTTPAIDDDLIVIGHSGGEVIALSRLDGTMVWQYPIIEVVKASPLLVGPFVVVGTLSGKLIVLDKTDGAKVAEAKAPGAIAFPPVTDGSRIYVATQSGRILCYGEQHEQLTQDRH